MLVDDDRFDFLIGGSGDEEQPLREYVKTLGLGNRVTFVGHLERPEIFYRDLDILLFTSKYEGTSRTILESFSTGLPVVCFDISSMKELVDDGKNGYKIPPFELCK